MVSATVTADNLPARPGQPASGPTRGVPVRPRPRRLQLRRQRDQRRLVGRAARPASMPIGSPSSVQCSGTLTAGCPVTLNSGGEGGVALLPLEVRGAVAVGVEPAQRPRRHRAAPARAGRRSRAVASTNRRENSRSANIACHRVAAPTAPGRGRAARGSAAAARRPGPAGTGSVVPDSAHTGSKAASTSRPEQPGGTSSTSWPSSSSSAEASSNAARTSGSSSTPGIADSRNRPIRSRPGSPVGAPQERLAGRQRRRPVRVAGHGAGHRVEHRRGVADGAGERPVGAEAGDLAAERARC